LRGTPSALQLDDCPPLGPAVEGLTTHTRFDLAQFEYWYLGGYRRFARCPAVLLNHDAWYRTVRAVARHADSPWRKLLWKLESWTVRRHETRAQTAFEWRLFLSEEDRRWLRSSGTDPDREAIVPVPFGFEPLDPTTDPSPPPVVVFFGGLSAPFNRDAAVFFVNAIWPHVRREIPAASFVIAGRDAGPEIRALDAVAGVRVAGFVPDLRSLLRRSAVAVSPCRIGTGIKVKVAEAMAAGLPVVGTAAGLSGYGDVDGVVRAETPEEFAGQVVRLLADETVRWRTAQASARYYREHLWLGTVAPRTRDLYDRMLAT
jgi:glycosyltransferase involved in cell wall biosynthesis